MKIPLPAMSIIHNILIVFMIIASSGLAQAANTPVQTVESLYKPYISRAADVPDIRDPKLYSERLKSLFARLKKDCKDTNEVCGPEFDFFVNGQDYDLKDMRIRQLSGNEDTAKVEASFGNMDARCRMTFEMIFVSDRWVINELTGWSSTMPDGFKLSEILVP